MPRILIVEDEPLVAMLLEDLVAGLGHTIVGPASTLEQGLAAARSEAIDAAILDVNLNGARSFPIADVLTARSVPHAFATGYGPAEEVVSRNVPVLRKPFRDEAIRAALDQLLGPADPNS